MLSRWIVTTRFRKSFHNDQVTAQMTTLSRIMPDISLNRANNIDTRATKGQRMGVVA